MISLMIANMYWVLATTYRVILSISQIFTHLIHSITLGKEGRFLSTTYRQFQSVNQTACLAHLSGQSPQANGPCRSDSWSHWPHSSPPPSQQLEYRRGPLLPHTCSVFGDQPRRHRLTTSNNTLFFSAGGAGGRNYKTTDKSTRPKVPWKGLAKI